MDGHLIAGLITDRLKLDRQRISAQWAHPIGTLTRHFHLDDLLPDDLCDRLYAAFPQDAEGFHKRSSFRESKRTSANLAALDAVLSAVTYAFQDRSIVAAVSDLLKLDRIEPDPKLYAGGLSMMFHGDFLNPHIDNSHDRDRSRYRRLNLLYYVSPEWGLEDGGNFELWDEQGRTPRTIVSKRNRLVVMETNRTSLHSVGPVRAMFKPRCCISNYYLSEVSPNGSDYFHVTSFTGRPEEPIKRALGGLDNLARQAVSRATGYGRGRGLVAS